ncbi:activating transcription factor 7-interacting protein 2 isoform X2 [Octodon degus]|uniref:Activating transcription factor 7-interacting protein 2 isoform X2 n=1 Tax=Octodon degus TaxID=10160 RepID=A0A6P6E579_OCTDE|nr:activating transcription factor 7-interacting protein 2 isoform X2 [Octodon degus]
MASPDRSKRRILKAKKTMPTSCRKQAEILNKSKTIEVLKTTVENNVPNGNQNSSTEVITRECRHPESVDSSLDSMINSAFLLKSIGFPQKLIKPVEKVVDSETRFEHIGEQLTCSFKKPRKAVDSPSQFCRQDVKEKWSTSETHFEYKANVTSSFFQNEQNSNLKSICHSPIILSDVAQNPFDDNGINKIPSSLEINSNSESHDEKQSDILSSNSCCVPAAKMPNLMNVVSSSNCAANTLKTKESSGTQHSSISDCENVDSKQQCLLNTEDNNSHNQKKMCSENKENVKHMKTSEQINENICVALERQTAMLEQIGNSETVTLDKNGESVNSQDERMTPVNCEPTSPSEKASEKLSLLLDGVEFVSESNDDVMLISVESPNLTTPVSSNSTDSQTVSSTNSSKSPNNRNEVTAPEKKDDFVIDLTKEGLSKCNTESPAFTLESLSKPALNSKETNVVAEDATEDLDSFEHLPPLPEPSPPLPELVCKIGDTLPPQKPELKVKWVLRPMGIALTWNITKIDPRCAPVESYHLFLCYENANSKLTWKKIGKVKALPLPMACTLSEFYASNRYYFTVQSKDIFGRYGPFCDIKSVPGFCDNLT